jgi:hypothetical protein
MVIVTAVLNTVKTSVVCLSHHLLSLHYSPLIYFVHVNADLKQQIDMLSSDINETMEEVYVLAAMLLLGII